MDTFTENVLKIWKEKGKVWLDSLPATVELLARQWNLKNLTPAAELSYNYVLLGFRDSTPIILKIGCKTTEIQKEAAALEAYNGSGCVHLIAAHFEYNALLIEQVIPGTRLKALFPSHDLEAVAYAASLMQQLHNVPIKNPAHFETISQWLEQLQYPKYEKILGIHIVKARELAHTLLATQPTSVLLHGDLHHENILSTSANKWLAIDPKGVIGDPAYEVGAFIRNPYPELLSQPNVAEIMRERLELFAKLLSIDKKRLQQWSYVQAVLAACWALDDGQLDPKIALAEAEIMDSL